MMSPKTSSQNSDGSDQVATGSQSAVHQQAETLTTFKSNSLLLNLRWSLRDEIVSNISKFSSLILGAAADESQKKRIFVKNNELIWKLTMLSFEIKDKCFKEHIDLIDYNVFFKIEIEKSKDLYFQIDWETRSQIIDQLIQNSSFATYDDLELMKIKDNLLKENNKLIKLLLSLPFKQIKDKDEDDEEACKVDCIASKFGNKKEEEIKRLKEEIKFLKKKIPEYSSIHWTQPLHSFDTNKTNDNPFKLATNSLNFNSVNGFPRSLNGTNQFFGRQQSKGAKKSLFSTAPNATNFSGPVFGSASSAVSNTTSFGSTTSSVPTNTMNSIFGTKAQLASPIIDTVTGAKHTLVEPTAEYLNSLTENQDDDGYSD